MRKRERMLAIAVAGAGCINFFVTLTTGSPVPLVVSHPLAILAIAALLLLDVFPRAAYRGPPAAWAAAVQALRASGAPLAQTMVRGTMGTLELRGPLLGMTVYPAGVVLKPSMLAANALPRATIAAIRVTPGLGGAWVEITHHAPTLATPIAVRLGTHDPVLSILTTWAGEDGRA